MGYARTPPLVADRICDLYRAGHSMSWVAWRTGVTTSCVWRILKRHNVAIRHHKYYCRATGMKALDRIDEDIIG